MEHLGKGAFSAFVLATIAASLALVTLGPLASFDGASGYILVCSIGWLSIGWHLKFRMRMMGAFVAPLATLIMLIQLFVSPPGEASSELAAGSWLSMGHVILSVFGMAFAILACALSIFYIWYQSLLKKKLLDQIPQSFPAIDRMERMLVVSLWAGFIFITLGLMSGAIYSQLYVPRTKSGLELKVVWAITVWVWYLATLLAKNVFGKPGRRIAQMSLGGFLLLAMTLFGMGFFRTFGGV